MLDGCVTKGCRVAFVVTRSPSYRYLAPLIEQALEEGCDVSVVHAVLKEDRFSSKSGAFPSLGLAPDRLLESGKVRYCWDAKIAADHLEGFEPDFVVSVDVGRAAEMLAMTDSKRVGTLLILQTGILHYLVHFDWNSSRFVYLTWGGTLRRTIRSSLEDRREAWDHAWVSDLLQTSRSFLEAKAS